MIRMMSLTMCLILPMSAFAADPIVTPVPDAAAAAPVADQPTQASLVPTDPAAAPNGATEGTQSCGMSRGCGGCGHGGKGKFIIFTGVIGTIVTVAAVGIAVGVARSQPGNNGQIPR